MNRYAVVPALPEHLPLLAAIERNAAAVFPAGVIPDALREESLPPFLLEEGLRDGNLRVALEAGKKPVGFALLRLVNNLALLAEIDVLPDHARQGIGTALIAAIARRATEWGHTALFLTTFSHVPWNAPFYARHGFTPLADVQTPQPLRDILSTERDHGLTNRIAMRLSLASSAFSRQ